MKKLNLVLLLSATSVVLPVSANTNAPMYPADVQKMQQMMQAQKMQWPSAYQQQQMNGFPKPQAGYPQQNMQYPPVVRLSPNQVFSQAFPGYGNGNRGNGMMPFSMPMMPNQNRGQYAYPPTGYAPRANNVNPPAMYPQVAPQVQSQPVVQQPVVQPQRFTSNGQYDVNPPAPPQVKNTQQQQVQQRPKKPWGNVRYIWPDFYTDATGDMWDNVMNAPYDMGRMPGGWRAPSLSSPDPVTVGDAVANQMPPVIDEIPNFMPFMN